MIYEKRRADLRAAINEYMRAVSEYVAAGRPAFRKGQDPVGTAAAKVEEAIAALEQQPDPPRGGAGWDAMVRAHTTDVRSSSEVACGVRGYDAGRRDAAAILRAALRPLSYSSPTMNAIADAIDGGAAMRCVCGTDAHPGSCPSCGRCVP